MNTFPTPPNKHEQRKLALTFGLAAFALFVLALISYHSPTGSNGWAALQTVLGVFLAIGFVLWWFGEVGDYDE